MIVGLCNGYIETLSVSMEYKLIYTCIGRILPVMISGMIILCMISQDSQRRALTLVKACHYKTNPGTTLVSLCIKAQNHCCGELLIYHTWKQLCWVLWENPKLWYILLLKICILCSRYLHKTTGIVFTITATIMSIKSISPLTSSVCQLNKHSQIS